ncbi:MAG TPA: hypothetical protein VNU24_06450 [Solirubrobacteraceae bacterium]|jgi:hypothetical protein|nr:hypothetical protein [Solirubrobacteraceae bacterium]
MFVLTTLVYPVVLALLCLGGGALVDRASGGVLPAMLFPAVGAATLIVLSQLSTYMVALAPATPYLLVAFALAGLLLGRQRLRMLVCARRSSIWQLLVCPLAYVLALAPVLLAGRPTFSSYMALADSAVHMLGADYLIRHGQDYSHLDLHNSYGLFVHSYYGSSYPSGTDALFGGSSFLLGLPLIWAFQPFVAFMLATAAGPAWVLVRRVGLCAGMAAIATLTITLPALVYAYELIGSVKEIAALPLILCMGALVVDHRRWLWHGIRAVIPFALVLAAGVAALGVAFGAWALAATLVLACAALAELRGGGVPSRGRESRCDRPSPRAMPARASARGLLAAVCCGLLVLLVAAWPTWVHLSGSVNVAQAIASTSNSGNLHSPLRPSQLFGVWLGGSYKLLPSGAALELTDILIVLVLVLVVVGVGDLVRTRRYALAAWFAGLVIVWLALAGLLSTWANAKTLMLSSPGVMLMAWAGFAALRGSRLRIAAPLVAFLIVGGVLCSDALLYHSANLAPTPRYEELASIDKLFAGHGPTLFTDFDEYSLYELRDMDVGGPDFVYPPPALAAAAGGYGKPVDLDRIAPAAFASYPLIVTRRDPSAVRPPAAYRLLWQGVYYQVWGRAPRGGLHGKTFSGAGPGQLVNVPLARTVRPHRWRLSRKGMVMGGAGNLSATFVLPRGGVWELWLKGDVMRALTVRIDGRILGRLGGQLDGNSLVVNVLTPLRRRLGVGRHTLTISRPGADLAPGDGGAATLAAIFLVAEGSP